ncbi:hypothetical protein [Paraburkholderia bannensis]|uniref:hypothetical protein n=1 Tax=Paraburkholderia bannensis TaxID=765414 RepID=UPI000480EB35|nr:hypothetical protein [Paraburkholderia bannensis]
MNCKPGDLAFITRAYCVENIGRIVEVLPQFEVVMDMPSWNTRIVGDAASPCVIEINGGVIARLEHDTYAWCPDAWMRPISGVPVTDDVHDEVPA